MRNKPAPFLAELFKNTASVFFEKSRTLEMEFMQLELLFVKLIFPTKVITFPVTMKTPLPFCSTFSFTFFLITQFETNLQFVNFNICSLFRDAMR